MNKTMKELFLETAEHIRKAGFRVFISVGDGDTHGWFTDGTHIGYFQQCETENGIQLATCNKTPGSAGTGLLLEPHAAAVPLEKVTKEYLEKAFADYPEYFGQEDKTLMPVKKFVDVEDFLRDYGNKVKELKDTKQENDGNHIQDEYRPNLY